MTAEKQPRSVPILSAKEKTGEQVLNICKGTYSSTRRFVATERIPQANP